MLSIEVFGYSAVTTEGPTHSSPSSPLRPPLKPTSLLLLCCGHTAHLLVLRAHQVCASSKPKDTQQAPLTTFSGFCSNVIFFFTETSLTTAFKNISPLCSQILSHYPLHFFPPKYLAPFDIYVLLICFVYRLLPTEI